MPQTLRALCVEHESLKTIDNSTEIRECGRKEEPPDKGGAPKGKKDLLEADAFRPYLEFEYVTLYRDNCQSDSSQMDDRGFFGREK